MSKADDVYHRKMDKTLADADFNSFLSLRLSPEGRLARRRSRDRARRKKLKKH